MPLQEANAVEQFKIVCQHCKSSLPVGLTMCYRCGKSLREPFQIPMQSEVQSEPAIPPCPTQTGGKIKGLPGIIAAVVVVLLLGGAAGGHYLGYFTLPLLPERTAADETAPFPSETGTSNTTSESTPAPTTSTPEKTDVTDVPYVVKHSIATIAGTYSGEWDNGMPNGRGEFTAAESGRTADGLLFWFEGDILSGTWVNGLPEGQGEYIGVNGEHYEGNYVNGLQTGRGRVTLPNGDVYTGEFFNGLPNGQGKYTYYDGRMVEGTFVNGEFSSSEYDPSPADGSPPEQPTGSPLPTPEPSTPVESGEVWIELSEMGITDRQLSQMVANSEIPADVTHLILYGNQISDLTPLSGLANLTALWLYGNQINDLTPLRGLTNLICIYAGGNRINNLTPIIGLPNLTYLHMAWNEIDDLTPLSRMSNLIELELDGNPLNQQQVDALKTVLPNCVINFAPETALPFTPGTDGVAYSGDAIHLRGNNNSTYTFTIVGARDGGVWGSDIYTDDSTIARAAVHAGLVAIGDSATVTIRILPGQRSYSGTTRNGVTSSSYDSWDGSYEFVR